MKHRQNDKAKSDYIDLVEAAITQHAEVKTILNDLETLMKLREMNSKRQKTDAGMCTAFNCVEKSFDKLLESLDKLEKKMKGE